MELALFDLDNTLLNGDSDYLWGRFLARKGVVDGAWYERENQRFYDEYKAGRLDIHEFLRFSLAPLAAHEPATLRHWHAEFMEEMIRPIITARARDLLARHRAAGRRLVIVTATNDFVTGPIAAELEVADLIATRAERQEDRYTGKVAGIPCFQHGKVERLAEWLTATGHDLAGSWFYSDSHNELPLLEQVAHPVAVDPDPTLARIADERGWPVISLR